MTSLKRAALDACADALRTLGFMRRRGGPFIQGRDNRGVTGWLGLNVATFRLPSGIDINPVVGVRHIALETAFVALDEREAPLPSISRPLGYLMPRDSFRQWHFNAEDDLAVQAADMAKSVAAYGQPFIEHFSDWQTFSTEAESSGLLLEHDRPKCLPIIAALNGDVGAAETLIVNELKRLESSSDIYARSYREFARRFAQYEW